MDRRTQKTLAAIDEAFRKLWATKPINEITVAEIATNSNIGRATFYLHYKDVYDLQTHIIKLHMDHLLKLVDESFLQHNFTDTNYMKLTRTLLDYVENNQADFKIMFNETNGTSVSKYIRDIFTEKILGIRHVSEDNIAAHVTISYITTGIVGVATDWINGQLPVDKKTLSKILSNILTSEDKNHEEQKNKKK